MNFFRGWLTLFTTLHALHSTLSQCDSFQGQNFPGFNMTSLLIQAAHGNTNAPEYALRIPLKQPNMRDLCNTLQSFREGELTRVLNMHSNFTVSFLKDGITFISYLISLFSILCSIRHLGNAPLL